MIFYITNLFRRLFSTNVYEQVPFKYEYFNVIREMYMHTGTFALLRDKFVITCPALADLI